MDKRPNKFRQGGAYHVPYEVVVARNHQILPPPARRSSNTNYLSSFLEGMNKSNDMSFGVVIWNMS